MKQPDIKYLFEPRGVAVIGASHVKGKIGYKLVENTSKHCLGTTLSVCQGGTSVGCARQGSRRFLA